MSRLLSEFRRASGIWETRFERQWPIVCYSNIMTTRSLRKVPSGCGRARSVNRCFYTYSAAAQDTPSRMPLIWRPPGDQYRPSTPPFRCSEQGSSSTAPEDTRVPISLVLLVLTGYICLGATVFAAWEEWTFLDGAYFCFITLSTIGFGDLVPGKSFQTADTQNGQLQLVACCAYLLLGLVLIAMSFTLVQEEVIAKCRQIALYIGILKRTDPRWAMVITM